MSTQETTDEPASSSAAKNSSAQLPITPDREKMSRALGAAFLQHKVQQLERNLDDLSFRRDGPSHPPFKRQPPKNQPKFKAQQPPFNPSTSNAHPQSSHANTLVPIKIIDTSVLIHALPLLKKWTHEGRYKIIVPLDVISELDFLKTSPPPVHGLVREATGWLDSQFRNSHNQTTSSAIDKPCIVPQRTGDEKRWDELSKRFIAPPTEVASIPVLCSELAQDEHERDDDQPAFINRPLVSTDLPQRHRSLLQCTLYYQSHAKPSQKVELVIFIPDDNRTNVIDPLSQSADSQQLKKSPAGITILKKNDETKSNKLQEMDEPTDDKMIKLFEWAEYFQLQVNRIFPSDLVQTKQQQIRNQNQNQNHNQRKMKILNNNHRPPSQQHHSAPHHQEHVIVKPSPSHQSPSNPTPKTILTRNRDKPSS